MFHDEWLHPEISSRQPPHVIWSLAQLRPNRHAIARYNLRQQGFSAFLPLHEVTLRRGSRFKTVQRPLFPGYIFVGQDAHAPDWRRVNGTRGITRLVRFGERPARVPRRLVEALRERFGEDACDRPQATLHAGERVTIAQGPFARFAARIVAVEPDRRVWVLVELMGRTTRVAVDQKALGPA